MDTRLKNLSPRVSALKNSETPYETLYLELDSIQSNQKHSITLIAKDFNCRVSINADYSILFNMADLILENNFTQKKYKEQHSEYFKNQIEYKLCLGYGSKFNRPIS